MDTGNYWSVNRALSHVQQALHVSSTNGHERPCNLKPQQRDLTPVLRRPVELAGVKRKTYARIELFSFDPMRTLLILAMIILGCALP